MPMIAFSKRFEHVLVKDNSYVIMLTCPCKVDPLILQQYILKLGFIGVHIIFLCLL